MLGVPAQGRQLAARLLLLAGAAAAGLLLASCATVPARTPSQWMGVLPTDATLYASVRVAAAKATVTQLLLDPRSRAQADQAGPGSPGPASPGPAAGPSAAELGQLIDRTDRLVLAVTLAPPAAPAFAAVALGRYPAGLVGCRLSGSRDWKKGRAPSGTYWQWKKTGLQVAAPGCSVLLAASSGIEGLLDGYAGPSVLPMPEEAARDMESRDLVLFLPRLPGGIVPAGAGQVPIREVWVVGTGSADGWTITGTARTGSEKEAKTVALLLRFALVAWMRGQDIQGLAAKLRTVTVAPEGSLVRLQGLSLSGEEMGQVLLSLVAGPQAQDDARGDAQDGAGAQ